MKRIFSTILTILGIIAMVVNAGATTYHYTISVDEVIATITGPRYNDFFTKSVEGTIYDLAITQLWIKPITSDGNVSGLSGFASISGINWATATSANYPGYQGFDSGGTLAGNSVNVISDLPPTSLPSAFGIYTNVGLADGFFTIDFNSTGDFHNQVSFLVDGYSFPANRLSDAYAGLSWTGLNDSPYKLAHDSGAGYLTPIPGSMLLMISGLLGLIGLSGRFRRN